ncbi:hypothetical protein EXW72_10205 [Pseudomonas sp. BCA14]|uniref:hypothetical protein n=1 Tax=unclassified Pseudomonas TaxID=196821 RepID=UPI00106E2C05|nr:MULTISPECIES: hypothetical protein [unclassified Pseudomonas]TFF09692.1 hypothetical protein EXW70_11705 [Pseudomonas sp. JMN1]TFF11834.1 hypothetical protein EXW71_09455 [Pseudomonas sp. BCA17]TFF28610.1 hypothetical protein EXW72_10205 [Pseudomonas sp. BCA14]
MTNNATAVNSYGGVATLSVEPEKVSRHHDVNQSAAMNAALLIGGQYSQVSKSQFRRACLNHLKASLAHAQDVSA